MVVQAVRDSADLVGTWRVLAAQVDASGRVYRVRADFMALAATQLPVIPVIRFEGTGVPDANAAQRLVGSVLDAWRTGGVHLAGVEIDADCATSQLGEYGRFLGALRASLAPSLQLSVTALPDWIGAPAVNAVLAATDETVLQVHSAATENGGIFAAERAMQWVDAWAKLTDKPFRIAVPNYGARLYRDADGRTLAIESEISLSIAADETLELVALPLAVSSFLREIESRPMPGLRGFVWFRLPVAGDVRVWGAATWRAVIRNEAMRPKMSVEFTTGSGGRRTLYLANDGATDGEFPRTVMVAGQCQAGEGNGIYVAEVDGGTIRFERGSAGLLKAGTRRNIGWVDCAEAETQALWTDIQR